MSEWKELKLGEILEFISKGTTPPQGKGFVPAGINYIKSEAISYDRKIDISKLVFIDNETNQKFKRSQLAEGDILFSMAGAYLGKNAIVTKDLLPANTNQALAILRIDKNKALPTYVSLFLSQKSIIEFVNNMSGQSAQPNINFEEIKSIPIIVPSLPTQTAIASILSSLDDKIDLLHRQNATLEKMAETLFRQWFVEEAKEDWEEGDIYNFVDIVYGFPFKSKHFNEERRGRPLIRIRDLKDGYSNIYTDEEFDTKYILKNGDLVAGMDGEFRLYIWSGIDSLMNQRTCKFIPKNDSISNFFIFSLVKPHLHFYEMTKVGTTVIHLGKSDLDAIKISIPPPELVYNFGEITNPWFEKLQNNNIELLNLKELREILLPKLMSGEITIKP